MINDNDRNPIIGARDWKTTETGAGFQAKFGSPLFNVQWLKLTIKQILRDQHQQFMNSEMHNSSKATYYKLFKNDIDFEEYLDKLNDGDRLIFCKFRTTNHRLIIETGRWSGVNREDRICNLCNQGLVGDEYHYYLLECIYFNDERKTYLRDEYCQRPDVNKFNLIMNCHNITELKKICQFIKIIFSVASCPP